MSLTFGALVLLPGLALSMTALNALTWRRGRPEGRLHGRLSVLIPARNEASRLPGCLRALAASTHPIHEIIVYDDESTDGTAAILAELAREIPELRVIRGRPLPRGWVGKPHACHHLAQAATGDVLCFLDADVLVERDGLARLASILEDRTEGTPSFDVVSAMPRQVVVTAAERLVVPFLLLSYLSWLPLELVARSKDPRVVAANGQVLAMRRAALERIGGFEAIAQEIVDDVALCRGAKAAGLRVAFADGTEMARCRMYGSAREVWEGFSKNIHEGVGSSLALAVVVIVYLATFVTPALALVAGATMTPALLPAAAVATSVTVAQQLLARARWGAPRSSILLHPIGALVVIAIAVNSLFWSVRGDIKWAGRRYAGRPARRTAT